MKKLNRLGLLAAFLGFATTSCDKKDEPSTGRPSSGTEMYDGATCGKMVIGDTALTINTVGKNFEFGKNGNDTVQDHTWDLKVMVSQDFSPANVVTKVNDTLSEIKASADQIVVISSSVGNNQYNLIHLLPRDTMAFRFKGQDYQAANEAIHKMAGRVWLRRN